MALTAAQQAKVKQWEGLIYQVQQKCTILTTFIQKVVTSDADSDFPPTNAQINAAITKANTLIDDISTAAAALAASKV